MLNWKRACKIFWKRWKCFVVLGMMLGQMLYCGGCVSMDSPLPIPGRTEGNALITTLPEGTLIQLPNAEYQAQTQALFINEMNLLSTEKDSLLRLKVPLKLCTESYILERDAAESKVLLELLKVRQNEDERILK